MHPSLTIFPSKHFYESRLKDAPRLTLMRKAEWHAERLFPPYCLYDVQGDESSGSGHSLCNILEAELCVKMVKKLAACYPAIQFHSKIGSCYS